MIDILDMCRNLSLFCIRHFISRLLEFVYSVFAFSVLAFMYSFHLPDIFWYLWCRRIIKFKINKIWFIFYKFLSNTFTIFIFLNYYAYSLSVIYLSKSIFNLPLSFRRFVSKWVSILFPSNSITKQLTNKQEIYQLMKIKLSYSEMFQ